MQYLVKFLPFFLGLLVPGNWAVDSEVGAVVDITLAPKTTPVAYFNSIFDYLGSTTTEEFTTKKEFTTTVEFTTIEGSTTTDETSTTEESTTKEESYNPTKTFDIISILTPKKITKTPERSAEKCYLKSDQDNSGKFG